MIANVEEVIVLDVSRSEHQMPGINPQTLLSILRAYALYNPEMEYCQGLNYVAGLMLMLFDDEEVAFRALITIVERYELVNLFNRELPKLKMHFYTMDRLIGVADTELHSHLKEEGISTTLFASAWFITIFTNTLKENAENGVLNESLMQVWDYFLCSGWKAVIKVTTYIITSHRHILKELPFEDILPHV